jgi:hypothetical protein
MRDEEPKFNDWKIISASMENSTLVVSLTHTTTENNIKIELYLPCTEPEFRASAKISG